MGFAGRAVDVDYPMGANINIRYIFGTAFPPGGVFLNGDALVIRFTTPALGVNDTSYPNFAAEPGSNGTRQATLGTAPCLVPTFHSTTPPVINTRVSQTPGFNLQVVPGGTCPASVTPSLCGNTIWVAPSTTYFITLVNKGSFTGPANTCTSANCDMRFNFNN